jgi:hypothetical protein
VARVVAVSMCRDEADVAAGMLCHLADEVDHILVADNGSTDGTRDILAELEGQIPLTVLDDHDPAYYQSRKLSALAERAARDLGARWIVPVDFDELWFSRHGRVSEVLDSLHVANVVTAQLTNHYSTAIDPDELDPFRRMVWRAAEPQPLPKVAFRWEPGAIVHQGNHSVSLPNGCIEADAALEVRHFPARSAEHFVRKARNGAAAYRATDLPVTEGAHWRAYGDIIDRLGESALADVYREHWWYLSPTDSGLIYDPAPYLRWRH